METKKSFSKMNLSKNVKLILGALILTLLFTSTLVFSNNAFARAKNYTYEDIDYYVYNYDEDYDNALVVKKENSMIDFTEAPKGEPLNKAYLIEPDVKNLYIKGGYGLNFTDETLFYEDIYFEIDSERGGSTLNIVFELMSFRAPKGKSGIFSSGYDGGFNTKFNPLRLEVGVKTNLNITVNGALRIKGGTGNSTSTDMYLKNNYHGSAIIANELTIKGAEMSDKWGVVFPVIIIEGGDGQDEKIVDDSVLEATNGCHGIIANTVDIKSATLEIFGGNGGEGLSRGVSSLPLNGTRGGNAGSAFYVPNSITIEAVTSVICSAGQAGRGGSGSNGINGTNGKDGQDGKFLGQKATAGTDGTDGTNGGNGGNGGKGAHAYKNLFAIPEFTCNLQINKNENSIIGRTITLESQGASGGSAGKGGVKGKGGKGGKKVNGDKMPNGEDGVDGLDGKDGNAGKAWNVT